MKILNVSYSDLFGGAAKSAYRIHKQINKITTSKMIVVKKISLDRSVISYNDSLTKFLFRLKNYLGIIISKFDNNLNPKSYNFFSSPILSFINKSEYDLINLHWVNAETLSIDDIKKIKKPYMITMHDMWWICGTENYLNLNDKKWKNGNFKNFFSKINFEKKRGIKPVAIICPSIWLTKLVKKSYLFSNEKVVNIPYPIDHTIYCPRNIKNIKTLKLNKNKKIKIFFSVFGDSKDHRKGIDLLIESLNKLDRNLFELIVASKNKFEEYVNFDLINLNYIKNEKQLSEVYNLCDIVVLASRLDNLPNVALEAQSCGKPIIAFNTGGISDIINDKKNGYLIKPFDTTDFSKKLNILIKNKKIRLSFGKNAYKKAINNWSPKIVRNKYNSLFKDLNID
jgi:glycosyltransferase involved in cell wall biosynthesis